MDFKSKINFLSAVLIIIASCVLVDKISCTTVSNIEKEQPTAAVEQRQQQQLQLQLQQQRQQQQRHQHHHHHHQQQQQQQLQHQEQWQQSEQQQHKYHEKRVKSVKNSRKDDSKIHHIKAFHHDGGDDDAGKFKSPTSFHKIEKQNEFNLVSNPAPNQRYSPATLGKNQQHVSNRQLFGKLGLSKLWPSHNRKRLAVESRRHTRHDDSHMFVIKLPPNSVYYSKMKFVNPQHDPVLDNKKKLSFKYQSNGRPGKIYHWNLPALKKIVTSEGRVPIRHDQDVSRLIDIKGIPTWSQDWENETMDKPYGKMAHNSESSERKSLKRKSPTFYAPTKPPATLQKNKVNKYFPGNGKPKGFYVIKKNKKPSYYKELLE